MITQKEQRATLLTLYPIFKEEVYRRREQMMYWTAIGSGSLIAILLIALLAPSARSLPLAPRLLLAGATLALAGMYALLIWQQHHRHRQAKQQLITLECALGLFGDIPLSENRNAYPEHWQTDWTRDRSLVHYLAILTLLTGIALAAIMLPLQWQLSVPYSLSK